MDLQSYIITGRNMDGDVWLDRHTTDRCFKKTFVMRLEKCIDRFVPVGYNLVRYSVVTKKSIILIRWSLQCKINCDIRASSIP